MVYRRPLSLVVVLVALISLFGVVCGFRTGNCRVNRRITIQRKSNLRMASVPFSIPNTFPPLLSEITSKVSFTSSQIKSIFNLSALTAVFITFRKKIAATFAGAQKDMEVGWKRRGDGSAAQRTVEVWIFTLSFGFKVVSPW